MTPNTRKPGESFETFKKRRAIHNQLDKRIGKGDIVHLSVHRDPLNDFVHTETYVSPEGKARILAKGKK